MGMVWSYGKPSRIGTIGGTSNLVGNERKVKFWYDRWCGDNQGSKSRPRLV